MLLRVMGPLRVEADSGAGIPVTRLMERRLLTALAARRPGPVATAALVDALWPDEPPVSAHKTIQTNVFRLRERLGRNTILTTEQGYRLADDVDVDVDCFERAVTAARQSGSWEAVLPVPDGVPFDDIVAWPPAEARRARIEELRRFAIESRFEALLDAGSDDELVPELEALVLVEPLREKRWCLLVRALAHAGRRAEALRAIERARRVFVTELGIEPGRELGALYETLLIENAESDRDPARTADALLLSDRQYEAAVIARDSGDHRGAVLAYCRAAQLARSAGDPRRLAHAALGAAGDGWTTGMDATDDVVSLLADAVAIVPTGPTPTRSKLLARLAVATSHQRSSDEGEQNARAALAIARVLEEPELEVGALHALLVVVEDPMRHADQRQWLDALLQLVNRDPDRPWRRWALPLAARLAARDGDVSRAIALTDELGRDAEASGDRVAAYAASHGALLAASVAGDWPAVRTAIEVVRTTGEAALFDPNAPLLETMGLTGIVDLYEGKPVDFQLPVMEWPRPSMGFAIRAWYADRLARTGSVDLAAKALIEIVPADLLELERDGYWLPTLGLVADAAHRAAASALAEVVCELLEPVLSLTIVDPGCLYRGSVAHSAGLAAATCGRRTTAIDLLAEAVATHQRQGSPWMIAESTAARAALV